MKTQFIVLIALFIMLLSTGPLVYFFTGGTTQIPYNETQNNENLTSVVSGNFTGQIVSLKPYISYWGIRNGNNLDFVNDTMKYLNMTNYTASVALNPSGDGYLYKLTVSVQNESDNAMTGFKMSLFLNRHFTESYAKVIGNIQMPPQFSIGNKTIFTENDTMTAAFLYSRKKGTEATLTCAYYQITSKGALIATPSGCSDDGTTDYLGLSQLDYLLSSTAENATMSLNVTQIPYVFVRASYTGFFNTTAKDRLQNETGGVVSNLNPNNESGTGALFVRLDGGNATSVAFAKQKIGELNLTITDVFSAGYVELPASIVLGNATKRIPPQTLWVKLGENASTGAVTKELEIRLNYGEITEIADIAMDNAIKLGA